jgi:hypothetical protein
VEWKVLLSLRHRVRVCVCTIVSWLSEIESGTFTNCISVSLLLLCWWEE